MKLRSLFIPGLGLVMLTALSSSALAAARSSTNYMVEAETLDSGGGLSQSSNYTAVQSLESVPIGACASAAYTNGGGYLSQIVGRLPTNRLLIREVPSQPQVVGVPVSNEDSPMVDSAHMASTATETGTPRLTVVNPSGLSQNSEPAANSFPQLIIGLGIDGTVQLTVQAQPGLSYRVEATDDIGTADWQAWGASKSADVTGVATWTEPAQPGQYHRFFRIVRSELSGGGQ
jgi:hypothetical protein